MDLYERSVCRCDDGFAYDANTNTCLGGEIVLVTSLSLNKTFLVAFADRKSAEHVLLALSIESIFLNFTRKLITTGVLGIQVLQMTRGSVLVKFAIFLAAGTRVNLALLQDALQNAVRSAFFEQLDVDRSVMPLVSGIIANSLSSSVCDELG